MASARMISDVACEPELPPLAMMSGKNSESTNALLISFSNRPIAHVVNIPPTKSTLSHPTRFLIMSPKRVCVYASSRASRPPKRWTDSVCSSWMASMTSSTVTMPSTRPTSSTTGSAIKSYSAIKRDASVRSAVGSTLTNSVHATSTMRDPSRAARSSRNESTPVSTPY